MKKWFKMNLGREEDFHFNPIVFCLSALFVLFFIFLKTYPPAQQLNADKQVFNPAPPKENICSLSPEEFRSMIFSACRGGLQ